MTTFLKYTSTTAATATGFNLKNPQNPFHLHSYSQTRTLSTQKRLVTSMAALSITPTTNISHTFRKLKDQGKVAFIPYITAGDPDLSTTAQALKMLDSCGSNVIELGEPYSDPVLDGPVIEASATRSVVPLQEGRISTQLCQCRRRWCHNCLVPLFYFRTSTRFLSMVLNNSCTDVGVHGLVVPDAPFEATKSLRNEAVKNYIYTKRENELKHCS